MADLPLLAIELITYKRTDMALRTIDSTCANLEYPKEKRGWYIADDGSPAPHIDKLLNALTDNNEVVIGYHNERIRPKGTEDTYFSGKGWSRGLGLCHQWSDFVLTLEDDWELQKRLDITRYVGTLRDHEEIGLMRLGTLAVGNDVSIVGFDGVHYLQYSRKQPYAYSGNPNIRHARFTRAYGYYAEEKNPGDIEIDFDWRFRNSEGPEILRPAEIDPWGGWAHIGKDKSYG